MAVISTKTICRIFVSTLISFGVLVPILAAVLPEDRADVLFHAYDGGGIEITGPSVLFRKLVGSSNSFSANYYIDSISSASIDVITSASPYEEKRIEKSIGIDHMHDKTTMSMSYTTSIENDYDAKTAGLNISQEIFGDLTTVSLGYSRGWDQVGKRNDVLFSEDIDRHSYRVGVSQILTKDMLVGFNYETITDEGFLNNPYRSVRYLDAASSTGYSFESERYPRTRTSNAISVMSQYYLPYRASIKGEYRFFNDSWGIDAHSIGFVYTHPWRESWLFDISYRYYTQTHADFYNDLFPHQQAQNFLARDKELSTFSNQTFGLGVSYDIPVMRWSYLDKGSVSLVYDYIQFDYDDFRNIKVSAVPGDEPLYSFSANTVQVFVSLWY
ncbi:MAG: DUF3570 domain-containing protein [Gammaproteobacteria bacterium]